MSSPLEIKSLVDLASLEQRLAVTRQNRHGEFDGIAGRLLVSVKYSTGAAKLRLTQVIFMRFLPTGSVLSLRA
jgi:hypothetical protein